MLVCLVVLTVVFFLLALYSIGQANINLLPKSAERFLSIKILDTASSASLFVTLLGALLVRYQFALSLLPRINYKSLSSTRKNVENASDSFDTWRVEMLNSGLGAAVVNSTRYTLEWSGEQKGVSAGSHRDIIDALTEADLVKSNDYWLENITTGFALSPKEVCPVFEIKAVHLPKIKRLDMELHFQDQLGGRYGREIFLIPVLSAQPTKEAV